MTALGDLRIVDFSTGVAGPFCTKMFADFGADVIKVEPPEGDPTRNIGPFPGGIPDPNSGGMFRYLNSNKRGVTMELGSVDCRNSIFDLCAEADVVVESFAPGHMESMRLGYADLDQNSPGIIMVSITPFGQSGPWRDYQATDLITYGASGLSYVNGSPDREPLKEPGDVSYFHGGACGFLGAMTALAHRDMTGEGQHVDVSILEASASAFSPQFLGAMHTGDPVARGTAALLPCKDGYVSLNVRHDATWEYMWLFFDDPDVAHNARYSTAAARRRYAEEIEALLLPQLSRYTMEELFHGLAPLRLLIGMTFTVDRLLDDPHLKERGYFAVCGEDGVMPGAPFRMSATPWRLRADAPALGTAE